MCLHVFDLFHIPVLEFVHRELAQPALAKAMTLTLALLHTSNVQARYIQTCRLRRDTWSRRVPPFCNCMIVVASNAESYLLGLSRVVSCMSGWESGTPPIDSFRSQKEATEQQTFAKLQKQPLFNSQRHGRWTCFACLIVNREG